MTLNISPLFYVAEIYEQIMNKMGLLFVNYHLSLHRTNLIKNYIKKLIRNCLMENLNKKRRSNGLSGLLDSILYPNVYFAYSIQDFVDNNHVIKPTPLYKFLLTFESEALWFHHNSAALIIVPEVSLSEQNGQHYLEDLNSELDVQIPPNRSYGLGKYSLAYFSYNTENGQRFLLAVQRFMQIEKERSKLPILGSLPFLVPQH